MSWETLYILDLFVISQFAISYYRNCYRKGYRIDLWHATLFVNCIVPYFFMLPFARSELNEITVGGDFPAIVAAVPKVFLLIILGYIAVVAGGSLWNLRLGIGARKAAVRFLDAVPRCSMMVMSSRFLLVFLSLVCLGLQSILLALYFGSNGFGFDLRGYTFAHPGARPFAQITALSSIWVASFCLARYVDTKEKILLACTLLLTMGLLFFGQRGNLISIYINVALCYLVKLRSRVSLFRIFGWGAVFVTLILYLGSVRTGIYSLGLFFTSIVFLLFYGNNFTDLRDFAWVYADWNHQLWLGKTYLAGLATFVPRGASDFRAIWSFGIATGLTVGLDTETHPGLKPGQFGEAFFNFGWLGVVIVGLIYGIFLRRVDIDVKAALGSPRPSMMKAFASTTLLTIASCFNVSLALPYLYALCGIYLFAWLFLRARMLITPREVSPAAQPGL